MDETKKGSVAANVEELKNKGNECVRNEQYIEAVLNYTQAIKHDSNNYVLYSNRSLAFLKMDQHYLALQDANETIRLQPKWAKGYFRRAEIEKDCSLYEESMLSYTRALHLEPHNIKLLESIKDLTNLQRSRITGAYNTIWICTCVGLMFGIGIVLCDILLTPVPKLSHPVSMVAFILAISAVGFGVGKTITMILGYRYGKSLAPPEDLNTNYKATEPEIPEKKTKYSKAQARQRYKQGKI